MTVTAREIAQAAIAAAYAQLEEKGLRHEAHLLPRLLSQAAADRGGIAVVTLVTPDGNADEATLSTVSSLFEKKLGKPIEVQQLADPSLIAGAVILFGDERMDFSAFGALRSIERQALLRFTASA